MEAFQRSVATALSDRDKHYAAKVGELQQSYVAHDAARNQQHAAQVAGLQQALESIQAQLAAGSAAHRQEAEDRAAAETELQARRAQVAAQHLELETHRAEIARMVVRAAELTQALAAEQQASAHWSDRAERLEAKLRVVTGQSHDAALDAAGRLAEAVDAYEGAVKRGDHISEQVAFHQAAVKQMRLTIEEQRAAHERLIEERQAARTRCVELESQLHALTADARHLAEGLQRAQAERDTEQRGREAAPPAVAQPPRLRLAGTGETA
jgi:chromosome segregation ATPase